MSQTQTRKRSASSALPLDISNSTKYSISDDRIGTMVGDVRSADQQVSVPAPNGTNHLSNVGRPTGGQRAPGTTSSSTRLVSTREPSTETQVARRAVNHSLVPVHKFPVNNSGPAWLPNGKSRDIPTALDRSRPLPFDDLDQRALVARREAEANRKSIPPFVQKLSSFLNDPRNNERIHWSEDGNSFVVADEDEFARTLIPELFKHNNYASFVRQLNMYGFHKKVGLSDNSMRSSERKNKTPSEYSHPYFLRGRPNLLWLIQKPKSSGPNRSTKTGHRSRPDDFDDDVDEVLGRELSPISGNIGRDDDHHHSQQSVMLRQNRPNLLTMGDTTPNMPQESFRKVQQELSDIRQNQIKIKNMLDATRREHQQLYGQAKAFQEQHEKHDTSINAILTFLATVYNKNLNSAPGGVGDSFSGAIRSSHDQGRNNVVDVDELRHDHAASAPNSGFRKRPLLLEGASDDVESQIHARKKKNRSPRPSSRQRSSGYFDNVHPSGTIQDLSDVTPTSQQSLDSPTHRHIDEHGSEDRNRTGHSENETRDKATQPPQADIMSMLQSANARNSRAVQTTTPMDFGEALSHLQHTNTSPPLTPGQRQNMLRLLGDDNPNPPIMPMDANTSNPTSLTPANSKFSFPAFDANFLARYSPPHLQYPPSTPTNTNLLASQAHYDQTNSNLDALGDIIQEQSNNITNLSNTLTPLSPSGSIPGLNADDGFQAPLNSQDLLDLDRIFNSDSYFNDMTQLETDAVVKDNGIPADSKNSIASQADAGESRELGSNPRLADSASTSKAATGNPDSTSSPAMADQSENRAGSSKKRKFDSASSST